MKQISEEELYRRHLEKKRSDREYQKEHIEPYIWLNGRKSCDYFCS